MSIGGYGIRCASVAVDRRRRRGYRGRMRIRIGHELVFEVPRPTAILLMLYAHPDATAALEELERLAVEPALPVEDFVDWFGNRAGRLIAPAGTLRLRYDNVARDGGQPEPVIDGLPLVPVAELPPECWRYLLASRYCEVDRMTAIAWDLFGQTPESWQRVRAVIDWVHDNVIRTRAECVDLKEGSELNVVERNTCSGGLDPDGSGLDSVHDNVTFGYQYSRPTKTAFDVFTERQGVCRDFQHLAITFLRALNVPARYATGYLGDIGVPRDPNPMDFSAWLEVYLGGAWYTLDARHNEPRIGRVLMGRGRDAVDVALTTSFGPTTLTKFTVWTELAS